MKAHKSEKHHEHHEHKEHKAHGGAMHHTAHKGHKGRHKKAAGGHVKDVDGIVEMKEHEHPSLVAGNKNVVKEAEKMKGGGHIEGGEHRHKLGRKRGGSVHHSKHKATGGSVDHAHYGKGSSSMTPYSGA